MILQHIMNQSEIKIRYPQPSGLCYLNTASSGLVSKHSIEKSNDFNEKLSRLGSIQAEKFFAEEFPEIRRSISQFVDAPLYEIALIPNFSFGLNAILPSINQRRKVLLYQDDYPSLTLPFVLNGFDIYWINSKDGFSIDLNEAEQLINKHEIEIVAISHVQYLTGYKIDLEKLSALCQSHETLLILDGTQSLGAIPFSFKSSGANIFITSNYKWMNGGYGTGIMCIDSDTLEHFPPRIGGFNSYKYIESSWEYLPSINSYEPGHPNMAGLALLKDAIDFKNCIGINDIAVHNMTLVNYFINGVSKLPYTLLGESEDTNRTSIIGIYGDKQLEEFLINNHVMVKMRNGIIRIGFHFYNTIQDIDRLIDVLSNYVKEQH